MDSTTPSSPDGQPRRGALPILARIAALTLSIGVVSAVTMRAGGCSSTAPDIQAESSSSQAAPATTNAPSSKPSAAPSAEEEEPAFMGGAKAPAGGWARPRKTAQPAGTPQPQVAPSTPTQAAPGPAAP